MSDKRLAGLERLEAIVRSARERGSSETTLMMPSKRPHPDAKFVKIAPGVRGRIVAWGDGTATTPTVVFVNVDALEKMVVLARAELEREPVS